MGGDWNIIFDINCLELTDRLQLAIHLLTQVSGLSLIKLKSSQIYQMVEDFLRNLGLFSAAGRFWHVDLPDQIGIIVPAGEGRVKGHML